ncbi:DUF721 domain-containing protein [Edaphobacter bradus]|uniref:DUF721 domain-containing protein n=1 Tax=Edaphobacter bradus TaxID=2259016 RepID=UPI0021E0177A|nr:DUF721 domain-containing protein [Edaphobacter bradus]
MEGLRDILRSTLGQSLRAMSDEDRIAAAWTVACGRALAERGTVVGFVDGVVHVEVADAAWMRQMVSMRSHLEAEVRRIAGAKVAGIHFEEKKFGAVVRKRKDSNERTGRRNPR